MISIVISKINLSKYLPTYYLLDSTQDRPTLIIGRLINYNINTNNIFDYFD